MQLVRKEHCVVASGVPVAHTSPGSYAMEDKG